jgi:hypothetical protein
MVAQKYLTWHFIEVPFKLVEVIKNYLKIYLNYFSIPLLLKTLFSPWRRYYWSYGSTFDLRRWVEVFFSNLISRIIGMIMRIFLICAGFLTEVLVFVLGVIVFLSWLILPFILIIGLFFGLKLISGF